MNKENFRLIYYVLSGSHAYGLATEESDYDYRGVIIPPKIYYFSPFKNVEQIEEKNEKENWESVKYELQKFVKLAADNNPNILELLFVDEKFVKVITPEGRLLRKNRNLFLSAKCKFTYSGYAISQLKRIKTHKKWLLNPVTKKPKRSDFGLDDNKSALSDDEFGYMKTVIEKSEYKFRPEIIAVFEAERKYRAALNNYNNYQRWLQTRNPKRAELERKYGYDTKHASHLVRLMLQAEEILTKGTLTVDVSDKEEIQKVRNGEWPYEELIKWAEDFDKKLDRIYKEGKWQSVIPYRVNISKIENLLIKIYKMSEETFWNESSTREN